MEFKTRISKITDEGVVVRGEKLFELARTSRFTDIVFLELSGRKPSEKESVLFEKMLSLIVDHGMGTTSSMATRFVASGGNALNVAVGGGLLSIGNYHGGAIENAMKQFYAWKGKSKEEVKAEAVEMVSARKVLFGFGHKHYKQGDPRVAVLKEEMDKIGFSSELWQYADAVEEAFEEVKGRRILKNIDCVLALLLCEFGFDPLLGKGIFLIGRTPGLVAQAFEELKHEKPVRRVSESEIEYVQE